MINSLNCLYLKQNPDRRNVLTYPFKWLITMACYMSNIFKFVIACTTSRMILHVQNLIQAEVDRDSLTCLGSPFMCSC